MAKRAVIHHRDSTRTFAAARCGAPAGIITPYQAAVTCKTCRRILHLGPLPAEQPAQPSSQPSPESKGTE